MRKFKHIPTDSEWKLDLEVTGLGPAYLTNKHYKSAVPLFVTSDSKDWEEIIEKEWVIIEFIAHSKAVFTLRDNGLYTVNSNKDSHRTNYTEKQMMEMFQFKINSVKRLSDGEVFTVGDNTTYGVIKELCLKGSVMHVMFESRTYLFISDTALKVLKEPLFTTEDGVEIFGGEIVWRAASKDGHIFDNPESVNTAHWGIYLHNYGANVHKHFSTKEKAEEYILLNKPCLSINDVLALSGCAYTTFEQDSFATTVKKYLKNKK